MTNKNTTDYLLSGSGPSGAARSKTTDATYPGRPIIDDLAFQFNTLQDIWRLSPEPGRWSSTARLQSVEGRS